MPRTLLRHCEESGLAALLGAYHRDSLRYAAVRAARPALGPRLRVIVDLLCLNESVPTTEAQAALGGSMEVLADAGLCRNDGSATVVPEHRLVDHYGQLLFVGPPAGQIGGYYGADSVGLGRQLLAARGNCLDLFASTGAQSLLMARGGGDVTSVELTSDLRPVAALNIAMHGLDDRVTTIWGDATTVSLPDRPFDTVCVNAPLFPNFGVDGLDTGANGGRHGHDLLQAVLPRVRLNTGGRLHSTATMVGDGDGPHTTWLADAARRNGWTFDVVVTGVGRLGEGSAFAKDLVTTLAETAGATTEDMAETLDRQWKESGVDRVFFCLLTARPAATSGVTVVSRYERGSGWWL
ncbi:class I SAM-dependent methyltransferase [Stackebrandtia soli]|uniref:class I SAM-dependent methyltransferase n=1 Tax=Stackebrandtia soli TaxID=1892856 RepID=UPI0039EB609D